MPGVLIYSEDPVIRGPLEAALGRMGIRVHVTGDGEAALSLLERTPPVLAVIDLSSAGASPWRLLAALAPRTPRDAVPVIVTARDASMARQVRQLLPGLTHARFRLPHELLPAALEVAQRALGRGPRGPDTGAAETVGASGEDAATPVVPLALSDTPGAPPSAPARSAGETRRDPRASVDVSAVLKLPTGERAARVLDVSPHGLKVLVEGFVPAGVRAHLLLPLEGHDGPVRVVADVRWSRSLGVGSGRTLLGLADPLVGDGDMRSLAQALAQLGSTPPEEPSEPA